MPPKSTRSTSRSSRRKAVSSLSVEQLAEDWFRAGRARDLSRHTLISRRVAIRAFTRFLESDERSTRVAEITRGDVEDFLVDQRARGAPGTVFLRFTVLRSFFNWLVDEEELDHSPMRGIKAPKTTEEPPTILSRHEVEALLKTCAGRSFWDRRDRAIFLLMIDTGMRLHEVAQLQLETVDMDAQTLRILGKGKRGRAPRFGEVAAAALAAYKRARARLVVEHPRYAGVTAFWLGKRGALGTTGIYQMVARRAKQAGIAGVHPHLFRHGFANDWLAAGGQEGDLAALAGWTPGSRMLYRYAAAQREDRARDAHKRLSPADRLAGREKPRH